MYKQPESPPIHIVASLEVGLSIFKGDEGPGNPGTKDIARRGLAQTGKVSRISVDAESTTLTFVRLGTPQQTQNSAAVVEEL